MSEDSFSAAVLLSLGSNLGNRTGHLRNAHSLLVEKGLKVRAVSSVYETPPWGFESTDPFYNLCLKLSVSVTPTELISLLLEAEKQLGRDRKTETVYAARIIDLDIILWDSLKITAQNLVIPHPRAHLRKFVLEPAAEIAPDWIHPDFGLTILQLRDICPDHAQICRIGSLL
jgi:2-amino-4-hydroxy-6-hydroxymethyldihydropteridine diphosphokinase